MRIEAGVLLPDQQLKETWRELVSRQEVGLLSARAVQGQRGPFFQQDKRIPHGHGAGQQDHCRNNQQDHCGNNQKSLDDDQLAILLTHIMCVPSQRHL